MIVSPAKTAELIETPFGMWTGVGPRNYVLDEGPEGAILRVKMDRLRTCPAVDILKLTQHGGRTTTTRMQTEMHTSATW